jgi:hypothetical protein
VWAEGKHANQNSTPERRAAQTVALKKAWAEGKFSNRQNAWTGEKREKMINRKTPTNKSLTKEQRSAAAKKGCAKKIKEKSPPH